METKSIMAKILAGSQSFCKYSLKMKPGEILKAAGIEVVENSTGKAFSEEQLLDLIEEFDGVIVGTDPVTRAIIDKGRNLKIIAKNGVGYDNIDVKYATEKGIYVTYTPGTVEQTVADSTFALMFALARNITQGDRALRKGEWPRLVGMDLSKKKLGIIGLGRIGRNIVQRSTGFQMQVYAYDPLPDQAYCEQHGVRLVSLDELLQTCDIVTIHAPLMDTTRHLVDARALGLMKPEALLINTSRGELVDEEALYQALKEKKIAGAAVDVYSQEPPPADFKLFELDNVIVTPHIAGYSKDAIPATGTMVAESVVAALSGQTPPNLLNKDVLNKK
jgi:D-3-phosphoglycerate dehydrogenase / 2-oxoglutarate reductase